MSFKRHADAAALIIGFSFSCRSRATTQRKNYEEREANAIGRYVRADLLPTEDALEPASF